MDALAGAPRLAVIEVTAHRPHQPAYHAKVQTLIGRVLSDARSGGWQASRHAAADVSLTSLLDATDDADAIVIVGGEDLSPHLYGGDEGYEGETRHYLAADEGQIALVRRALARQTPLLGICRGLQVINVALGGTVEQHIGDGGIHRNAQVPIDQVLATHAVHLHGDSRLAAIHGGSTILVESAHHQAVARIGAGLVSAAVAPDGLIEALEHETAPIIGVQWHPEAPAAVAHHLPALLQALAEQVGAVSVAA